MGRWGDGIYEGDASLDYLLTVTGKIERELAYWLSPEQVTNSSWWLAQVLTVTELVLLFEDHHVGIHLETKAAKRWREVVLQVWDSDWKDSYQYDYPYESMDYRQQNRHLIVAMFDRLESIAHYWEPVDDNSLPPALIPLPAEYPLPHFSINKERFTYRLMEALAKDIIYYLSPEMRAEVQTFNVAEVWVAVDVLAFLCMAYKQSPGVNEHIVRQWRAATIEIDEHFAGEKWDESDKLHQEVMSAFDRLEAAAKQYPPYEW